MKTYLLVALDEENGIGKEGDIPWDNKKDKRFFREQTTKGSTNLLVCGKNTYDSMKDIVLMNRDLLVVTQTEGSGYNSVYTLTEALEYAESKDYDNVFFIGGEGIYKEAQYLVDEMIITNIEGTHECDKFFTPDYHYFEHVYTRDSMFYYYEPLHPDKSYAKLCHTILREGEEKNDRTGTGTLSKFGYQMKFNLSKYLPVLTTKKVYLKGVIKELLWFIKGGIDSKELEQDNVNIWKGNTSTEFLKSRSLDYEEGECGPIYGFQWRHWNAPYIGKNNEYYPDKYKDQGIDQLQEIIKMIKTDDTSRRMILSAWNPQQLNEMALPPCHIMCQFNVCGDYLDCHMYQRSADVFLGLPFNITSYSVLTHLIASTCNKKARNLHVSIGDAHIYKNHISQVKTQLSRNYYTPPQIEINKKSNIDEYTYDDIQVIDYNSHPTIKAPMAV